MYTAPDLCGWNRYDGYNGLGGIGNMYIGTASGCLGPSGGVGIAYIGMRGVA